MRSARSALIFCIGLYAVGCQALLFRQFLVSFEGNELGIGAFFGSWLVWIGIGAVLVYRRGKIVERLIRRFEFFALLYLPAFVIQHLLIGHARQIMGIDPYQLFSFSAMIAASFIVNAPLSLLTGMLFPLACQWVEKSSDQPIARVYLIESAGSFMGGLIVTMLLWQGVNWTMVFLIIACLFAGSVTLSRVVQKRLWWAPAILVVFLSAIILTGWSQFFKDYTDYGKWRNLLPSGDFNGSFQTAQAEYLWGEYQGQFIVACHGEVIESLPEAEAAGEISAIHLSQNPQAKRILLAGSNTLGVAEQLLQLEHIEEITLFHTDPQYLPMVRNLLTEVDASSDPRLDFAEADLRMILQRRTEPYDIAVLNFPDATSAALNRYSTVEFYQAIKAALSDKGVVGVRIAGGENVIGSELADLGASAVSTLNEVFNQVVIKPGVHTWLLASDGGALTEDPVELHRRFAGIVGAEKVYPPTGVISLYPANRVMLAHQAYDNSYLSAKLLINRDTRPLGHLYNLLLLGRHAHSPLTRLIKTISLAGLPFFVLPILLLLVLRGVYVWGSRRYGSTAPSNFEIIFLIFSVGMISIGTQIVLMYLYQTYYGSLYLYIGLTASLFMLGLAVGAGLGRFLLKIVTWRILALSAALFHTLLLTGAVKLGPFWNNWFFIAAFILCGILTGIYIPPAAKALERGGYKVRRSASVLDLADHFGAALGALLTGIVVLTVLGADRAFLVLAALTGVNILFLLLQPHTRTLESSFQQPNFFIRKLGYFCFGIGLAIVLGANLLAYAAGAMTSVLTREQAALVAPEKVLELIPKRTSLADSNQQFSYFEIIGEDQEHQGYIFSSRFLAGEIRGYAGPIHLVIRVDSEGRLQGFRILSSYETPAYLELLEGWPDSLVGQNLFTAHALPDVAAVTGATITCDAIVSILQQSGRRFGREVLGRSIKAEVSATRQITTNIIDVESIYLLAAMIIAVVISRWGGRWSRRLFLLIVLGLGGWYFNLQYSSEQIVTLLSGHYPNVGLTHNFLMVIGIPVLVILLGNLYCGYLCPFGALQEFVDFLIPRRRKLSPRREFMQWARFGKYLILLFLVGLFFMSGDRTALKPDVLITFFGGVWRDYRWYLLAPVLLGILLYTRFWCRYLCPAGAFLALLGRWSPLKRLLPAKKYSQCVLGVAGDSELDCIRCDRCRYESTIPTVLERRQPVSYESTSLAGPERRRPVVQWSSRLLMVMALSVMLLMAGASTKSFVQKVWRQSPEFLIAGADPAAGQPRDVDMNRMQQLIQQQRLSDHEALYYEKIKKM